MPRRDSSTQPTICIPGSRNERHPLGSAFSPQWLHGSNPGSSSNNVRSAAPECLGPRFVGARNPLWLLLLPVLPQLLPEDGKLEF